MKHPPDGFVDFVAGHSAGLQRFAYLLTGDFHAAEDLVQTALLKLLPRWSRVIAAGAPDAYVRTVIVNAQRSTWRRSSTKEQPRDVLPEVVQPNAAHRQVEDADLLSRALARLPRGQRAAVVLRFYEDRSEQETALILGCSVGTVKSQTHRALAALKAHLEPEVNCGSHR